MTPFISFLVFCQALGAFSGAFAAVWGELAYIRAMKDGKIDTAERAHLTIIANGLRFGMLLILLSSFGLVVVAYALHAALQPALSVSYWTLIVLTILIIGVSWALSRRRISFALGSAIVFVDDEALPFVARHQEFASALVDEQRHDVGVLLHVDKHPDRVAMATAAR